MSILVKWTIRSGIGAHDLIFSYPESSKPEVQIRIWRDSIMGIRVTDNMFIPWHSIHSIEWKIVETDQSKTSDH